MRTSGGWGGENFVTDRDCLFEQFIDAEKNESVTALAAEATRDAVMIVGHTSGGIPMRWRTN